MSWADNKEKTLGFTVRGRIALPSLCGWAMCGWSECGDENDFGGTYQMRRKREGIWKWGNGQFGSRQICKMMPTWPEQPASSARDAQQAKFSTALSMWQALTDEQKAEYNRIASHSSRRGYDYFMSKTLKSL